MKFKFSEKKGRTKKEKKKFITVQCNRIWFIIVIMLSEDNIKYNRCLDNIQTKE